ncbi:MAG: DUF1800 family protein [Ferruginibacter sp.]
MGNPTISRRDFFRTLSIKKETISGDPLFDKYSRKSLGPRVYSNQLVSFNNDGAAAVTSNETGAESLRVGNVTSGLAPYTGSFGVKEATHLLSRTGFGFKKAHADTVVATGSANAAVNMVLTINNTPPPPPINWYNNLAVDAGGVAFGADWTQNPSPYIDSASTSLQDVSNRYRMDAQRSWLVGQALNDDVTVREKMVWFWYHFMPIDFEVIDNSNNSLIGTNSARIFYSYFKMFRDNALGNFKTLVRNMATQPAMMYYLNNQANTATAPDENFARELMELFTLGKDPLSQYTQADVVAAAQVLTGWRVENIAVPNPVTTFVANKHKTGVKQFSSFFGNATIQNATPTILANGALELDALIDLIFTKTQVVSEYICRRLYRYFVYYDIDANIETNVITPLAQTFVANNWNILPVLQQLFKSQHFFDVANKGVIIKSPFDLILGSLKHFNLNYNVSVPSNHEAQYRVWTYFNNTLSQPMEQRMGSIPNVSGWNAYYQTPAYHQYWINTNTIQKRFSFLERIFGSGYSLNYASLVTLVKVDVIAYVQQFTGISIGDPNALVAECLKYLLPVDLSIGQKDAIKQQTLLYQQITDSYWTTAWANYMGTPTNASYKSLVTERLKNLLYTIVQLAEYQLM